MPAHSFGKSIGHTTAKDKVVNLIHKVFDDADFGRHFRAAHDCGERTFDVAKDFVNSCHFLFHQVTEHFVFGVEIIGDNCGRRVFAVGCTKCVVHIYIGI